MGDIACFLDSKNNELEKGREINGYVCHDSEASAFLVGAGTGG